MYNRVQLKRLVKIVELLRSERYPNSKRIVAELEKSVTDDLNELDNLRCSEKTAKRDIKFHRSIHDALYAKPLHKDQIIDFDETSENLTLYLPECSEEVVHPWVLAQMGKAEILEPEILRERLYCITDSINEKHHANN